MTRFLRTKFVEYSSAHEYGEMSLATSSRIDDAEAAAQSFAHMAQGNRPDGNEIYGRLHNDTVAEFEDALSGVEGTDQAVAFGSGMAALTALLLAAAQRGENVVALRPLYGGSDHLLCDGLTGLDVRWTDADGVAAAVDDDTALVLAETPANPTLDLVDIEALVDSAGDTPVVIDSTFATPALQNPAELGATLVLHSATKYIGGHGDIIGGIIATTDDWARRLRQVRIATGGLLHPMAAYLLRRGLATLPVRMEAAQETAHQLATRLVEHDAVDDVFYPGLNGCDPHNIVDHQMKGPGAMLALTVDSFSRAQAVMENVEVITPAVSLGTTDSLIQHPASLTHQLVDEEARQEAGVSDRLLRISVGLEHVEDLWADLDAAL